MGAPRTTEENHANGNKNGKPLNEKRGFRPTKLSQIFFHFIDPKQQTSDRRSLQSITMPKKKPTRILHPKHIHAYGDKLRRQVLCTNESFRTVYPIDNSLLPYNFTDPQAATFGRGEDGEYRVFQKKKDKLEPWVPTNYDSSFLPDVKEVTLRVMRDKRTTDIKLTRKLINTQCHGCTNVVKVYLTKNNLAPIQAEAKLDIRIIKAEEQIAAQGGDITRLQAKVKKLEDQQRSLQRGQKKLESGQMKHSKEITELKGKIKKLEEQVRELLKMKRDMQELRAGQQRIKSEQATADTRLGNAERDIRHVRRTKRSGDDHDTSTGTLTTRRSNARIPDNRRGQSNRVQVPAPAEVPVPAEVPPPSDELRSGGGEDEQANGEPVELPTAAELSSEPEDNLVYFDVDDDEKNPGVEVPLNIPLPPSEVLDSTKPPSEVPVLDSTKPPSEVPVLDSTKPPSEVPVLDRTKPPSEVPVLNSTKLTSEVLDSTKPTSEGSEPAVENLISDQSSWPKVVSLKRHRDLRTSSPVKTESPEQKKRARVAPPPKHFGRIRKTRSVIRKSDVKHIEAFLNRQRNAAKVIQLWYQGRRSIKAAKKILQGLLVARRIEAARKIQRWYRDIDDYIDLIRIIKLEHQQSIQAERRRIEAAIKIQRWYRDVVDYIDLIRIIKLEHQQSIQAERENKVESKVPAKKSPYGEMASALALTKPAPVPRSKPGILRVRVGGFPQAPIPSWRGTLVKFMPDLDLVTRIDIPGQQDRENRASRIYEGSVKAYNAMEENSWEERDAGERGPSDDDYAKWGKYLEDPGLVNAKPHSHLDKKSYYYYVAHEYHLLQGPPAEGPMGLYSAEFVAATAANTNNSANTQVQANPLMDVTNLSNSNGAVTGATNLNNSNGPVWNSTEGAENSKLDFSRYWQK